MTPLTSFEFRLLPNPKTYLPKVHQTEESMAVRTAGCNRLTDAQRTVQTRIMEEEVTTVGNERSSDEGTQTNGTNRSRRQYHNIQTPDEKTDVELGEGAV